MSGSGVHSNPKLANAANFGISAPPPNAKYSSPSCSSQFCPIIILYGRRSVCVAMFITILPNHHVMWTGRLCLRYCSSQFCPIIMLYGRPSVSKCLLFKTNTLCPNALCPNPLSRACCSKQTPSVLMPSALIPYHMPVQNKCPLP